MPAVLLTVNPVESAWHRTYAADVESVRRVGVLRMTWPVTGPAVDGGADVWLLSDDDGAGRVGLIGHGVLAGAGVERPMSGSPSSPGGAGSAEGVEAQLLIDVDVLLPRGDGVPLTPEVQALITGTGIDAANPDVSRILSPRAALAVRTLWSAHSPMTPGSTAPHPGALPMTAVRYGAANRFELDPDLRRIALAHRGSTCHACDLDGEQTYGRAGVDLIQLHLVTPTALIDEDFVPDALVDLVPLCPTCHVVVHSARPEALTVAEVRAMVRAHGFLPGAVMSEHQVEAEAAMVRILDAGD